MAIWDKGSVTFRRFTLAGKKPVRFDDEHVARLKEFARPAKATADRGENGWGAGGHPKDVDFTLEKQVFPDHLLFELWRQEDKLPQDRLKVYYETDLKALASQNPSGRPTAKQKREAKEAAREQLEKESQDGRWLTWSTAPVMWGLRRNDVYLGTTSAAAAGRFDELFAATFGKTLTQPGLAGDLRPVSAGTLARAVNPAAKAERLTPFLDVPEKDYPTSPKWHVDDECPDYLGCEFLVWLWWTSEKTDTVDTPDGSKVTFMFSGGIKFVCPLGQTGDSLANHASGVRTPEARAAARSGKLPRKAVLTLVRHDDQFQFKLQPERMEVSGLKLPKPDGGLDARGRHLARLEQIENAWAAVEQLYAAFLTRRLASNYWAQEAADIRAWIKKGKKAA